MSAKRRRKRVESALQDEEADNNALSSKRPYVTAVTERTTSTSTSTSRSSKMKIVIEDPETLTQWTSVGVSRRLTSDADIARFLLTLYWDVKGNPTAAQKAECAVCHTSLDLYCRLCRASSPHALPTTPPQSSHPPSPRIIGVNPQQSDPARLPVLQAGNDSSAPVHSGGTDTGTSDTSGMLKSVSHSEDVLTQLPDCSDIAGTGRLQECELTVQPGSYVGNGIDGKEEEPSAGSAGDVDTEVSDSSPHAGESSMQESYQSSGVVVSLTQNDSKGREVDVSLIQNDKGREVDVSLTLSDKGTGVDVSLTQSDKGTGIDISTQNNRDTGVDISTQNNKDTGVDISSTQSDKSTGNDISSTQSDKAQRKSLRKLPAAEREIPQEGSSQKADAELFVCLCCGVNLPSSQHRSHVRTHHQQEGGGFSCQGCSKTFPHFQALYSHSKLRARDRKCPQCQATLLSGCQVTKHRRQHEREKARFCTHCHRSFPAMTKKDFDRHLTKHQTKGKKKKPAEAVLCPQCGKVFKKKEDLNNHMTYHNKDSPFPCPLCPKAFKNRACLRQHRLFHGEKTQQCEVCGDKFYRKAGLRRHMQKHTGKRHACQECTHRFYSPTELQVHVDSVHKGIRHFSCPRCELRFYKAASLKIHMRTHTGEKPFGCDQCPARFTVGEALRKHMRRHTGEKPFVCEDCGQRYACQYSYTTHRTKHHTHRRYTCGHCPQAFVMRSSLRFHRKMCHEGNDNHCK